MCAEQIKDGTGKGFLAQVDSENNLATRAVNVPEIEYASDKGDSYSITSTTYDYAAADTILLIKNTSTTQHFNVNKIYISGDTATQVIVHIPTSEVTPAGTAITPRNLNAASAKTAAMTAMRDETANSQGNIMASLRIVANTMAVLDFGGALEIPTNESLGVDFVTDGAACDVCILGHYEDD